MLCTNSLAQKNHMRHPTAQSILHLPLGTLLRFSNLNKIFSAHLAETGYPAREFFSHFLTYFSLYLLNYIFYISQDWLPYSRCLLILQWGCKIMLPLHSFHSPLPSQLSSYLDPVPLAAQLLCHFAHTWAMEHAKGNTWIGSGVGISVTIPASIRGSLPMGKEPAHQTQIFFLATTEICCFCQNPSPTGAVLPLNQHLFSKSNS